MKDYKIDFSKFTLKCDNDDCKRNPEHRCCVSCKSYKDCLEKGWTCIYLKEDNFPENCKELYLKKEGF